MSEDREHDLDLSADKEANQVGDSAEAKWDENVLPADDFADDTNNNGDDDVDAEDEPAKRKSGLAIFAVVGLLALGGAGVAYTQFGSHQNSDVVQKTASAEPVPEPVKDASVAATALPVIQDPQLSSAVELKKDPASASAPNTLSPSQDVANAAVPQLPKTDESAAVAAVVNTAAPTADAMPTSADHVAVQQAAPSEGQSNKNMPTQADGANNLNAPQAGLLGALVSEDKKIQEPVVQGQVEINSADVSKHTDAPALSNAGDKQPTVVDLATSVDTTKKQLENPSTAPSIPAVAPVETHALRAVVSPADHAEIAKNHTVNSEHAAKKPLVQKKASSKPTQNGQKKQTKHMVKNAAIHYELRSVANDEALISRDGSDDNISTVHVGDNVPGIGAVQSISQLDDGRWVVIGSKGKIY